MAAKGLKRQAMTVAVGSGLVRALGFVLRFLLAALLGAQALGVSELAASVYMLVLTPVVAGLPAAISRMTATEKEDTAGVSFYVGKGLALKIGLIYMPIFIACAPLIAKGLGDSRTLLSLLVFAPCIPVLAVSCAYDGYLFGVGEVHKPARSDLLEQVVRILACAGLLTLMPLAPTAYRAAVPALSMTLGEAAGLVYLLIKTKAQRLSYPRWRLRLTSRALLSLSVPLTVSRLFSGALKTACSVMIPARLAVSGLSYLEGVSQLGVYAGMAMPVLMLPAMFSGALGTVGTPAIARLRREDVPGFCRRLLTPACLLGALSAAAVFLLAPVLATRVFHQKQLTALYQVLSPLCLTGSVQAVISGIYNGLGLQKKALVCTVSGALLTLLMTYFLTALPALRLLGTGLAMLAGQVLTIILSLCLLPHFNRSSTQTVPSVEK